jgi:hypothetical protein
MAHNALESGRILRFMVNCAASIFRAGDGNGGSGQKLKYHIKEDIFLDEHFKKATDHIIAMLITEKSTRM